MFGGRGLGRRGRRRGRGMLLGVVRGWCWRSWVFDFGRVLWRCLGGGFWGPLGCVVVGCSSWWIGPGCQAAIGGYGVGTVAGIVVVGMSRGVQSKFQSDSIINPDISVCTVCIASINHKETTMAFIMCEGNKRYS